MKTLIDRIIRTAKLDGSLYEEIKSDKKATIQAASIVVLSSACAGIAAISEAGLIGFLIVLTVTLLGWYLWAYAAYYSAKKLFPYIEEKFLSKSRVKPNPDELLRIIGFSAAPGFIRILGLTPTLALITFIVSFIWMLAAMAILIQQAIDHTDILRAVISAVSGWIFQFIVLMILLKLLGMSVNLL